LNSVHKNKLALEKKEYFQPGHQFKLKSTSQWNTGSFISRIRSSRVFLEKNFLVKINAKKLKFYLEPPLHNSKIRRRYDIISHVSVAIYHAAIHTGAEAIKLFQLFDTGAHSSIMQQKRTGMLLWMRQPRFCLARYDLQRAGCMGSENKCCSRKSRSWLLFVLYLKMML